MPRRCSYRVRPQPGEKPRPPSNIFRTETPASTRNGCRCHNLYAPRQRPAVLRVVTAHLHTRAPVRRARALPQYSYTSNNAGLALSIFSFELGNNGPVRTHGILSCRIHQTTLYAVTRPMMSRIWNGPFGEPVPNSEALSMSSTSPTPLARAAQRRPERGTSIEFSLVAELLLQNLDRNHTDALPQSDDRPSSALVVPALSP